MTSDSETGSSGADTEMLRRVERVLDAFDPSDSPGRVRSLLDGLLAYAGVADHPPMLVARAVHDGALRAAPNEPHLPAGLQAEECYAAQAGRVIAALWYMSVQMEHVGPMDLQARAHQALDGYLSEEQG
jgi:hypothetical protein